MTPTPTETVLEFVAAVNRQQVDSLADLMTPDHRFVDSLGNKNQGREAMQKAWHGFFTIVPDYRVVVEGTFTDDVTVVVIGRAKGTYAKVGQLLLQNRWEVPAAWKAVVRDGRIAEWHAFVDNEPLRRVMRFCGEAV